jgi:hypothetical protein
VTSFQGKNSFSREPFKLAKRLYLHKAKIGLGFNIIPFKIKAYIL